MTEEEKEAREILNNTEWDGFMITIKNLIKKQDTEINKLKNVIDKLVNFISLPEKLQKEVYCEYVTSNEDCCWKTDKECKDCIKEYFMKEISSMENIYKADYMQDPCDCLTKENLEWLEEHCKKAIRYERKEGRHEHQITLDLLYRFQKQQEIIANIKEYANNEIESATEDIADYIDDDREGNKNIIGELKEWREHWKDIIRIMNNEKTYMNW